MPATTIRQQVLAALKTRAQAIDVDDGYNTDAGARVLHGNPGHTKDDGLPRVVMSTAAVQPEDAPGKHSHVRLSVTFIGEAAAAAVLDPLDTAEDLLADLKKALLLTDRTLGGLALNLIPIEEETIDREDGSTLVGARLVVEVHYRETYGDPYGAPA